MMVNEAEIRKYAVLMQELGLTGLEITEDKSVVRLERSNTNTAVIPVATAAPTVTAPAPTAVPEASADYVSVKSPIVGVFYAAPAENAEPYVSVGSSVNKGDTLCIIEAMKLMNEISAESDGVISEICVSNGQIVEYGTELFRIRR